MLSGSDIRLGSGLPGLVVQERHGRLGSFRKRPPTAQVARESGPFGAREGRPGRSKLGSFRRPPARDWVRFVATAGPIGFVPRERIGPIPGPAPNESTPSRTKHGRRVRSPPAGPPPRPEIGFGRREGRVLSAIGFVRCTATSPDVGFVRRNPRPWCRGRSERIGFARREPLARQIGFARRRCGRSTAGCGPAVLRFGMSKNNPIIERTGGRVLGKPSGDSRNRGSRSEGSDARSSPGAAGGFSHQCPCRYALAAGATSATRRVAAASERKSAAAGRILFMASIPKGMRRKSECGLGDRGNIASGPDGKGTDGKGIFLPILRSLTKDRGMSLWAPPLGSRGSCPRGALCQKCIRMGSGRTIPGGSSFCDYPGTTTYEFQSCRSARLGRGYRDRLSPGL